MLLHVERLGPQPGIRITGIVLVLIGAAAAGASASSAGFDLGEDLELGRAVHDVDGGPVVAWVAAALLLAVACVAVANADRAAHLLVWLGIGAAVVTILVVVVSALAGGAVEVGFGAIPFVIAFFSFPTIVVSLLFKSPPQTSN